MNPFEQNLLFGVTALVITGTLIVFVWQAVRYFRDRGRGD